MGIRKTVFAPGEWYHCYSRGLDKRKIFLDQRDKERFIQLLYLTNAVPAIHRSNLRTSSTFEVLQLPRNKILIGLGAFCLMNNHFHLLIKEIEPGGLSAFMQKLGTAYTMYFNIRYERTGGLLTRPFRARHVSDDRYFKRVLQYIHFNPAELYEPQWKTGVVRNLKDLESKLLSYSYSSLSIFNGKHSSYRPLLDSSVFELDPKAPLKETIEEARLYYAECGKALP
jgi:REP element-mobilizing transposase RayT